MRIVNGSLPPIHVLLYTGFYTMDVLIKAAELKQHKLQPLQLKEFSDKEISTLAAGYKPPQDNMRWSLLVSLRSHYISVVAYKSGQTCLLDSKGRAITIPPELFRSALADLIARAFYLVYRDGVRSTFSSSHGPHPSSLCLPCISACHSPSLPGKTWRSLYFSTVYFSCCFDVLCPW